MSILIKFIKQLIVIIEFVFVLTNANIIERFDEDIFPLSIIHWNDFHARFVATTWDDGDCSSDLGNCIGGYARVISIVKQLNETRTNSIYLNAGDNFQGTYWYTYGRWNITSYFLNLLSADAMTIGNHEFDNGIEGIVPFLNAIESPIVVCNIDDTAEPTFQGKYQKSIVIERSGRQIGIIGVILSTTKTITSPGTTGNIIFKDECESIVEEIKRLKEQGVNIIIILSHCGLDIDKNIAETCGTDIDVIVGGHTHTLMADPDVIKPPNLYYNITESYPIIINNVIIVQAWAYTKVVGDLIVNFDEMGFVIDYTAVPHFIDTTVMEDPDIVKLLQPWKDEIELIENRIVGYSKIDLEHIDCYGGECNIGNLVTDSMVHYYTNHHMDESNEWTFSSIAIINAGGIRAKLNAGNITFGGLVKILPFENIIGTLELKGEHLWETIEYGYKILQVSGLKIVYNSSNEFGTRLMSVDILCNLCEIPEYRPLEFHQMYRLIVPSFLVGGGDGFTMINDNYINYLPVAESDLDQFQEYIQAISPIILNGIDGRIQIY